MTTFIRARLTRRATILGGILAALLAIVAIGYALNQFLVDRNTGLFSVDVSEASNLQVEFFGMTAGAGTVADETWCQGDATSTDLYCVAKVSSLMTTNPIDVDISVSATAGGPLADDLDVAIYRIADPDGAVRDACRLGDLTGWTQILAPAALSTLPAATTFSEATTGSAGDANHVCIQVAYSGDGYSATPGTITTSATLSIVGTAP